MGNNTNGEMVQNVRRFLAQFKVLKNIKKKILFYKRKKYFPILKLHITPPSSIIANNCFGGRIPQDLGYLYNSPTAGLFFPYPDYIIFLKYLPKCIQAQLKFKQSSSHLNIQNYLDTLPYHVPIGYIEVENQMIEIIFLHYHTENEAREKWERWCKRVDLTRLIVFGSDNDECTKDDVYEFLHLPFQEKFFFSAHDYGIKDSDEYCLVREMMNEGKVNTYDKAHILYRYLCRLKYRD